jgi:hypothetical protein
METTHRESADSMRELLASAPVTPKVFRAVLTKVSPNDRDAWLDLVFALDAVVAARLRALPAVLRGRVAPDR